MPFYANHDWTFTISRIPIQALCISELATKLGARVVPHFILSSGFDLSTL